MGRRPDRWPERGGRGAVGVRLAADLEAQLARLDRRPYPAYKDLRGAYALGPLTLYIDHVQGDPYAAPSRLRVRLPRQGALDPALDGDSRVRRVALADFLARHAAAALALARPDRQGSGHSGEVRIDAPGAEVLERSACRVADEWAELRLSVGLPAAGRTILGRAAATILLDTVPAVARRALRLDAEAERAARRHLDTIEDAEALRAQLPGRRLVAFVADGAILPRASGVSQRPLAGAVPFASPPELRVTLAAPHAGEVSGLGVPEGLTVIVGGGFHGKSTLLNALARGVYDHPPDDGRAFAVARADAMVIRAEDGRQITGVDIAPFIHGLPSGADTTAFSTANASGSTSQAANIVEALEAGSRLLLMDEDTCATNFLIRDALMRRLVPAAREPITPYVDRVRELERVHGVSTVLVMGGSGAYLGLADTVIWMDAYHPRDATARARALAAAAGAEPAPAAGPPLGPFPRRVPDPASMNPERGGRTRLRARDTDEITYGAEEIDLRAVEQLVDPSQTRAIAGLLAHAVARGHVDGRRTLAEALALLDADLDRGGLDILARSPGEHPGDLARPRMLEVAAAINRLRSLAVRQVPG
ncbi:MAG TPA: ABC-ATPase domain-containing protein [Thermomicrobiales bacterium]|nr:ABC-ATPase domain-containing protein [Thermomicrobiales bacterium]